MDQDKRSQKGEKEGSLDLVNMKSEWICNDEEDVMEVGDHHDYKPALNKLIASCCPLCSNKIIKTEESFSTSSKQNSDADDEATTHFYMKKFIDELYDAMDKRQWGYFVDYVVQKKRYWKREPNEVVVPKATNETEEDIMECCLNLDEANSTPTSDDLNEQHPPTLESTPLPEQVSQTNISPKPSKTMKNKNNSMYKKPKVGREIQSKNGSIQTEKIMECCLHDPMVSTEPQKPHPPLLNNPIQLEKVPRSQQESKSTSINVNELQGQKKMKLVITRVQQLKGEAVVIQKPQQHKKCQRKQVPSNRLKNTWLNRCYFCQKRFKKTDLLKQHLAVHTMEKPFSCNQCKKEFAYKGHFTVHKTLHANPSKFSCDKCGKSFSRKSYVKVHDTAVHLKVKNFCCPKCNIKFSSKCHMTRHLKEVHLRVRHSCPQPHCNKTFSQKSQLGMHVKQVHPSVYN